MAVAGISWGGKIALIAAADHPELVDALALICPGLQPRVGVSLAEKLRIAWAFFTDRRKTFPIPLTDPALFTDDPAGRDFIAADRLGLHAATAGLLAASTFIDRMVRRRPGRVRQPALLMLAGLRPDRRQRPDPPVLRPAGQPRDVRDRVSRRPPHPGIRARPHIYARDLAAWLGSALATTGT